MLGYVAYHNAGAPPYRVVGGIRFRAVCVARGEGLRARLSARRAARTLARAGVRLAVFPPEYPHCEAFARYGVEAPPLAPLYRATAAAIARRYAAQRGLELRGATLAFAAESVTPELRRAAQDLCAEARYITLAVPRGGAALAQALRRDYGVAARVTASGAPARADLTVCFDGGEKGRAAETGDAAQNVLSLGESLRVVYDGGLPNELLAALRYAGALDADALRVKSVALPDSRASKRT